MPSIIRSALLVLSVVVLPHLVEGFWGGAEATLEEFYEVRDICKATLRADLRNGLVCGD